MYRTLFKSLMAAMLVLVPSVVMAHEGHGHTPDHGNTAFHYLTEPVHLLQIVTAVAVVIALYTCVVRIYSRGTQHR